MENINILIDEKKLQKRVIEIAQQIEKEYEGKKLILICILKGSIFFTIDLARNINGDVRLEFVRVSSYGTGTESSGKIDLKLDIDEDSIKNKDVIIVEDIIDSGRTLKFLKEYLSKKGPNSIKICTLLDKKERRICDVNVDYVGFDIPDEFVVGYGLDADEKYRNLPYVGYIK